MLDLILKKAAAVISQKLSSNLLNLEKGLGYRISFEELEPNWINGLATFDMSETWKKVGLKAIGINYFTIGSVKNGISTRFDPTSPFYQAWLGGYIVRPEDKKDWAISDHWKLGEADQNAWLSLYGDPDPETRPSKDSFKSLGKVSLGKFHGEIFEGAAQTHSDLSAVEPGLIFLARMGYFSGLFNRSCPGLKIKPENLYGRAEGRESVNPYHDLIVRGYTAVVEVEPERKMKAVLYASGVIFKDKRGKEHNTFNQIKYDLMKKILSVKIERV